MDGSTVVKCNDEVCSFDFLPSGLRGCLSQLRWLRGEGADGTLSLFAQRRGQGGDSVEEVLALLGPTEFDDFVILRVEHAGEVAGNVVVEVEPGFCVGAP